MPMNLRPTELDKPESELWDEAVKSLDRAAKDATEGVPLKRSDILNLALQTTLEPAVNLGLVGSLKLIYWKWVVDARKRVILPSEREAIDQIFTRLASIGVGPQIAIDTYVEGAAYFAIAGELAAKTLPAAPVLNKKSTKTAAEISAEAAEYEADQEESLRHNSIGDAKKLID